jgi:hypothetical protein
MYEAVRNSTNLCGVCGGFAAAAKLEVCFFFFKNKTTVYSLPKIQHSVFAHNSFQPFFVHLKNHLSKEKKVVVCLLL